MFAVTMGHGRLVRTPWRRTGFGQGLLWYQKQKDTGGTLDYHFTTSQFLGRQQCKTSRRRRDMGRGFTVPMAPQGRR